MKRYLFLMVLFSNFYVYACPDISGEYIVESDSCTVNKFIAGTPSESEYANTIQVGSRLRVEQKGCETLKLTTSVIDMNIDLTRKDKTISSFTTNYGFVSIINTKKVKFCLNSKSPCKKGKKEFKVSLEQSPGENLYFKMEEQVTAKINSETLFNQKIICELNRAEATLGQTN